MVRLVWLHLFVIFKELVEATFLFTSIPILTIEPPNLILLYRSNTFLGNIGLKFQKISWFWLIEYIFCKLKYISVTLHQYKVTTLSILWNHIGAWYSCSVLPSNSALCRRSRCACSNFSFKFSASEIFPSYNFACD